MSVGRHLIERWAMRDYAQEKMKKATDEAEQTWWKALDEKLSQNNLHALRMMMTNTLKVGCDFEPNTTDRDLFKKLYKQIVGFDFWFHDELENLDEDDSDEDEDEDEDEEEEEDEVISAMISAAQKELERVFAEEDAKCA